MHKDDYDDRDLQALIKSLDSRRLPSGRIGILGTRPRRKIKEAPKGSEPTNAEIGAKHEFGLDGMPIRSWLRAPISDLMQRYIDASSLFKPEAMAKVIKERSLSSWLRKVLILGESIVADAFDTGGFGKWKPSDFRYKRNHQTLVETTQLRNAVTSDLKVGT